MNIELKEITVSELVDKYEDLEEKGVFGFHGKLDIRPPYQREFIYKDKQRDAVIDTIIKSFPLNVMYWAVKDNGNFEVIDGQQRTISICQYVEGDFAFEGRYFHNLKEDEQDQILNYKLMVYQCTGTDSEKLKWFETINIAGEKLTPQELRNAVFSGSWVSDAKRYFSKTGCPAKAIGSDYVSGKPIRQEYLETAIKWINNNDINEYMAKHQHDPNAVALWNYFQSVISWVKATFPEKRSSMKSVNWGYLYNRYKDEAYDPVKMEVKISELILDDEVTKKSGIYPYLLTGDEKYLSLRSFTDSMKQKVYEKQKGICPRCKAPNNHYELNEMEADHITPWSEGGRTTEDNCQMLCKRHNREKSNN